MLKEICKRVCSIFIMILILLGIGMSILNFSVKSYADEPIYGTRTAGDGTLAEAVWELAGRYIGTFGGTRYYCCLEPRNCVVVFAN